MERGDRPFPFQFSGADADVWSVDRRLNRSER
jgi:hypothetical protein